MNSVSLRLLRKVAKNGELPLAEALRIGRGRMNDHRDQYPLTLLIEDEYLGCTLSHTPPDGAEKMREYSQVIAFHMFTLPKRSDGTTEYMSVVSSGSVDPKSEKVFLKSKGALYLEEYDTKKKERLFALFLGIAGAFLGAWFATWLK